MADDGRSTAIRRILQLDIVEARGILACQKNTSDPYVIAVLCEHNGRELTAETFNTKQLKNTLCPKWEETFFIGKILPI